MVGKRIIRIDEKNTSQTCCTCGKTTKRTLYERTIQCDCGNCIDRDLNSAINIMNRFLENKKKGKYNFLSQKSSMNEESFQKTWNGFLQPALTKVSRLIGNSVL